MENLAPPLQLCQSVRSAIENGESVRTGLTHYLEMNLSDDFAVRVRAWSMLLQSGCSTESAIEAIESPSRRQLLSLVERGLRGEPILVPLTSLETEIKDQCLIEMDEFLAALLFQMLLPLLFCFLPAFLLMLVGPLLLGVVSGF